MVHFCTNAIGNEFKSKPQCIKPVKLFSLVVQLFENIDMGITKFVQLWRKLYILLQILLQMNLSANHSVPKLYSCFLWFYSFLKILIWG